MKKMKGLTKEKKEMRKYEKQICKDMRKAGKKKGRRKDELVTCGKLHLGK